MRLYSFQNIIRGSGCVSELEINRQNFRPLVSSPNYTKGFWESWIKFWTHAMNSHSNYTSNYFHFRFQLKVRLSPGSLTVQRDLLSTVASKLTERKMNSFILLTLPGTSPGGLLGRTSFFLWTWSYIHHSILFQVMHSIISGMNYNPCN